MHFYIYFTLIFWVAFRLFLITLYGNTKYHCHFMHAFLLFFFSLKSFLSKEVELSPIVWVFLISMVHSAKLLSKKAVLISITSTEVIMLPFLSSYLNLKWFMWSNNFNPCSKIHTKCKKTFTGCYSFNPNLQMAWTTQVKYNYIIQRN